MWGLFSKLLSSTEVKTLILDIFLGIFLFKKINRTNVINPSAAISLYTKIRMRSQNNGMIQMDEQFVSTLGVHRIAHIRRCHIRGNDERIVLINGYQ